MKIEICPLCEGTGQTVRDVGTHHSDYEYSTCHKCNNGKIIRTSVSFNPALPYSEINKSILYKVDSEIYEAVREIFKKYGISGHGL